MVPDLPPDAPACPPALASSAGAPTSPSFSTGSCLLSDEDYGTVFLCCVCGPWGTPCGAAEDPFRHLLQPLFPQNLNSLLLLVTDLSGWSGAATKQEGNTCVVYAPLPSRPVVEKRWARLHLGTLPQQGREWRERKETGPLAERKREARMRGVCACVCACVYGEMKDCLLRGIKFQLNQMNKFQRPYL